MRYIRRTTFINTSEVHSEALERRGLNGIRQYRTPKLRHIKPEQIRKLSRIPHVWTVGDRLYKLAHEHYGDSKYWWAIAWYNKRPTESHIKLGDIIFIPQPLETMLRYLGI